MPTPIRFPKRFLWGASISAHQTEGANTNQWTVWELENAKSLATQAPYHYGDLPAWPRVSAEAKNPDNYISGQASDHLNQWPRDIEVAAGLGLNSLRFSIEWSRIEPEEGGWDSQALQHYKDYLSELKRRDLTPVVTLFHFTLPIWFQEKGGFAKRANVRYFTRFVDKIAQELGPQLSYVITINEPTIYAWQSYGAGIWPPNLSSKWQAWRVLENLLLAHKQAASVLHQRSRRINVSMAHNLSYVYAGDDAWLSRWSARVLDWLQNRYLLRRSLKTSDFIGLNYYFSSRVYGYRVHNPEQRVSDLGWDMQPGNLQYVLEDLADRYKKPIIVTENGLADGEDKHRAWWLQETIQAMHQARQNGADLRGYIHWSLIDNFEWDKGRWPRFGLVAIDYKTGSRQIRPSAKQLAKLLMKLKGDK